MEYNYGELCEKYDRFVVTGVLARGGRFRAMSYRIPGMAFAINLWRGSVWGVLPSGKRKLLRRVVN